LGITDPIFFLVQMENPSQKKEEANKLANLFANAAVVADNQGEYNVAIDNYAKAVECHLMLVQNNLESNPSVLKQHEVHITEYLSRAESLKNFVKEQNAQNTTNAQLNGMMATAAIMGATKMNELDPETRAKASNLAMQGFNKAVELDSEYHLREKFGSTAISVFHKASDLDKEYSIHQKVGDAAKTAYSKAKQLDQEYEIHQKVGDAAKTAYSKAKQLDQEYEIHQKVGNFFKTGFQKAKELDQQYEIHQKVGGAIKTGISKAKEIDEEYEIHQTVGHALSSGVNVVVNAIRTDPAPQRLN